MSNRWLIVSLSLGLLLAVALMLPGSFAEAQDKKPPSKKEEKKLALRDMVELENPTTLRAKKGFELGLNGDKGFVVRRAGATTTLDQVNCGVCTGGTCKPKLIKLRGICRGCGSLTGKDCDFGLF